ncbi:MAG TPA: TIGR00730 family Rossman fold protein [Piscinibacter sp.]|uniref:LOG family protein n=1 Tax=Piscinibacter sp. TaxID=1903157 RepID=UPI001B752DF9|nr:TIGR00730 family Rossman fold protein [Piscinibacter sp.]MBK7530133.1 TIGR00730 family Rossman fold protein [Piscinibacter sp.]MBP6543321.1 TIGR00730 family Rossman fold protein [Piscinibacter sp.]HOY36072.1 TIGR00730 family Rossman fold protein [Piscinibacter sp.]HPG77863.1 TIGR00730 family Rossman fold protein [Piscinibacter sp.]HPM64842.1 TIGR00730 family Rossman fold protein [Piscinibacter sp.]
MSGRVSLCVYCGSRAGDNAAYEAAARAVGTAIGRRGWRLVYGGGRAGLMGRVADAALAAGAPVLGVIPRSLMEREVGHRGLTELHVVETMHERKLMMAQHSDAFIALPGGIGTFEELFEVWTWRQLGYHDKPVGLLNVDGYYDSLLDFMRQTVARGFVSDAQNALLQVHTQADDLLDSIARLTPLAAAPDDYRRI